MKQVTQRLRDGKINVVDVPPPVLNPANVLVDVRASLLSAGTERSKVETARQSMLGKARSRPDDVRQVIEKARRDGVRETVEAVRSRLDQPSGLGYSSSGFVLAVGSQVRDVAPGDHVACGGATAQHADVASVPANLCVPLPPGVDFAEGAFTTIGSIALHAVRQADVRLGERVAVLGLGLVGQLAGQLLHAAGCTVVGVDLFQELVDRAIGEGAVDSGFARSDLDGELPAAATDCDAVIISAATRSDDPVTLAAALCRDRGTVVVVGDVGMRLPRAPYYEKEIDLRLSRSYGPGRYDREYEERGLDYPVGYVRWTERRNMGAFLQLLAAGQVSVTSLISARTPIDDAPSAYEELLNSGHSALGIVLEYKPSEVPDQKSRTEQRTSPPTTPAQTGPPNVGVIGAGSFAQRVLIPAVAAAGFSLQAVASAAGLSAHAAEERFDFARVDTPDGILADPDIGLVVVATRHASHARLSERALLAGKAVFVEKPPCLDSDELEQLRRASAESGRLLEVGFNRRHSPLGSTMRTHVAKGNGPIELLYRINAGPLPDDHWLNDLHEGGGRLLGEGCHFVDFACWVVGDTPKGVTCVMRPVEGHALAVAQSFVVMLDFADGSVATISYGANGARRLPKEYVEAHAGGRSAVLDDFKSLTLYEGRNRKQIRSRRQDKGYRPQWEYLRRRLEEGGAATFPSPLDSMAVTLAALRSAELGQSVSPAEICDTSATNGRRR